MEGSQLCDCDYFEPFTFLFFPSGLDQVPRRSIVPQNVTHHDCGFREFREGFPNSTTGKTRVEDSQGNAGSRSASVSVCSQMGLRGKLHPQYARQLASVVAAGGPEARVLTSDLPSKTSGLEGKLLRTRRLEGVLLEACTGVSDKIVCIARGLAVESGVQGFDFGISGAQASGGGLRPTNRTCLEQAGDQARSGKWVVWFVLS